MRSRNSLKNIFSHDRRILYIILTIVMVSVLTLTIVYAALSTTLNINGQAEVTAASWDIYLDNIQLNTNSATTNVPTITDSKTATFSTTLSKPGDFYEFSIDVVNNGTIDAMIDSITKTPELTDTQKKYLNYIVEYQNGEAITTKQLVTKKSFVRLKVKVEFRKDITALDLPTTSETLNLSFKVNYVQSDDNSENTIIDNNGKLIKIVSGNGSQVGDEICIGEECFYVISSNEESVTMLSKYNLYVGGSYNKDTQIWTAYGSEATGLQDSSMLGYTSNQTIWNGTTVFSNLQGKYSESIVEKYVNNYRFYLEDLGAIIVDARLITTDELKMMGCVENSTCSNEKKWLFSSSYWTNDPDANSMVWRVSSDGYFYSSDYYFGNSYGVRPVITISRSLL